MATKTWKAEYAKSICKICDKNIEKGELRLGNFDSEHFDGNIPKWNHASCVRNIESIDDVEGVDKLRMEDRERVNKCVDGPEFVSQTALPCKKCAEDFKGQVCILARRNSRRLPYHPSCFLQEFPSIQIEKITGWDQLGGDMRALLNRTTRSSTGTVDAVKVKEPLVELMSILFNVETYRAALLEFQIDISYMPLKQVSTINFPKGFKTLSKIHNLLTDSEIDASKRDRRLVRASEKFLNLIPPVRPLLIKDVDHFRSKVKMLEALQDIEIACKLLSFDGDESLDQMYKKLRCGIAVLPHGSEDYKLVEKYLINTHDPTHTDWSLELEDVFSLERDGESDQFTSSKKRLGNRMLLWHGSPLTSFVSILSQGLRIAPHQAPSTCYMFGKGLYFADMVTKSAECCFTDGKNPMGLMLLSEVALGKMHELKEATYNDKLPKGRHSTKGLGRWKPQESEFIKWNNGVVVPWGKPVLSESSCAELKYNDYVVYDTTQVKLQFLVKVKFKHNRGASKMTLE